MKKSDKVERHIRTALDCGYGIISAAHSAEEAFNVRVQPRTIQGGFEVTIYYCRLGNAVEKASVFYCSTDGWYLPSNVVSLPVKRKSRLTAWIDSWFFDFVEGMN